jgi:hypothetical protein
VQMSAFDAVDGTATGAAEHTSEIATFGGGRSTVRRRVAVFFFEIIVAGFALFTLLVAQWTLSSSIPGTNYDGTDGKMAQATILAALRFGGLFQVTNVSPLEGVGSQMLPMNVWLNPAYWPFHSLDLALATDVSALIALACFTIACYVMLRCFDVPVVPSAIAAQLCIVLFAPSVLILGLSTVFCLTPGNAVAYAPHMMALGLLARLEPGSWRTFGLLTAAISALLFYSLCCDPLWTMVDGFSWSVAFAVVTLSPLNLKAILVRGGALGCFLVLLFLTRAMEYVYTLSQYTARVQFAAVVDRPRWAGFVSNAFDSSATKFYYVACVLGWLLGILALRGRPRVLVLAAATTFVAYFAYSTVFMLLKAPWTAPMPVYVEHCLFPLFLAAGVAGYWGALRVVMRWRFPLLQLRLRRPLVRAVLSLVIVAIIPSVAVIFAAKRSAYYAEVSQEPWPNDPELLQFLTGNIGRSVGEPFRGTLHVLLYDNYTGLTTMALWAKGVPTVDEYSQLVTPQVFYTLYTVFQNDVTGHMNEFVPLPGPSWSTYFKTLQLFGTRYYFADPAHPGIAAQAHVAGHSQTTMPRRPAGGEPGLWQIYELPRPNTGNYSPTEVLTAQSAAEITARMREENFDFTKQVMLSTPVGEPLVAARNIRLSLIRGGLHVSGTSESTSLVVLPQQFSNCLRARDSRVRIVRADLMMAGLIFSGEIDTDILFDYGIFTPGCRWIDLADLQRLQMKIDLRMPHLAGEREAPHALSTDRLAGLFLVTMSRLSRSIACAFFAFCPVE